MRRCRTDSWFGQSARIAVSAAHAGKSDDEIITLLWQNYTYQKTDAARQHVLAKQHTLPGLGAAESPKHYLNNILCIPLFMKPFFHLLLPSIEVGEPRRTEANLRLTIH